MRLNFIRIWGKTHVLPFQSQHAISFYHIFKNKFNHTQSIIIPIYKSNQSGIWEFIWMLLGVVDCIEF